MSGANFVQWWQTQAVPACKAETKGDIRYTSTGSPEVLQRIKAAGASNGDIDLLFLAPDKIAGFHGEGVLEDLGSLATLIPNLAKTEAPDKDKAAGVELKGVGAPFFRYTYALIYNSDQVKNPPRTWKELYERRDEWKGKISYVDPRSTVSGAGRFFTAMFLRAFGANVDQVDASWDQAWARLKEFEAANARKHAESGGAHVAQFATGEIVIGFHALDFALYSRKLGTLAAFDQDRADGGRRAGGRGLSGDPEEHSGRAQAGGGPLHQLRAVGCGADRNGEGDVRIPRHGRVGQAAGRGLPVDADARDLLQVARARSVGRRTQAHHRRLGRKGRLLR